MKTETQKIKVTVPESIADIKLDIYQRITSFEDNDDIQKFAKRVLSIHYGLTDKQILAMKMSDREYLVQKFAHAINQSPALTAKFKHDDLWYGFAPNLDEMSFAEFVDLETVGYKAENLHKLIAILYRPITKTHRDTYEIQPYRPELLENAYKFKEVGAHIAVGMLVFFCRLEIELVSCITNYSLQKEQQNKPKSNTVKSGRGMRIFTRLREAMF